MKRQPAAPAAVLPLVMIFGASSPADAQDRETRPLTGFDAIAVSGGIDLFVRQSEDFLVEVESDDDPSEIVTEVRNGTLEIRRARTVFDFFDWGDHGAVHIALPSLTALTASGGSDVRTEGTFTGDELEVVASGGSDLEIDVAVTTLHVTTSGGSDARLSGRTRTARFQSSGGSDLNAARLTANDADVQSSGGSDVSIAVSDTIVANASGGSDIRYTGDPRTVDVNASGGADVNRR